MAWLGLLGLDQQKSRFHAYLALLILIILLLGHLSDFSFEPYSIRERWAEQALSLPGLEAKAEHHEITASVQWVWLVRNLVGLETLCPISSPTPVVTV